MSRDNMRQALRTARSDNYRPTTILVRGNAINDVLDEIKSKSRLSVKPAYGVGLESQQQDDSLKRDAIMSLFVFKPKQTGFASVAEATAAAIKNPESTAILVLGADAGEADVGVDQMAEAKILIDEMQKTGAQVYSNIDEAVSGIDAMAPEYVTKLDGDDGVRIGPISPV